MPEPTRGVSFGERSTLQVLTTKGDIITHDGTEHTTLGVGANDQVLTADSTQNSGVKWAAGGGGGSGDSFLEWAGI